MCSRLLGHRSRAVLAGTALLSLLAIPLLRAASRNIAPDAVSRATTWNRYEGDLATLHDGKVPPQESQPFAWKTKGVLVFAWPEVLPLEKVRLYVGEQGSNYQVRAFVGGVLDDTGSTRDPEGELTAMVDDHSRAANQWVEIPFPEGTLADNIELWSLGSAIFHEVEIQIRQPDTAVQTLSWGRIKGELRSE